MVRKKGTAPDESWRAGSRTLADSHAGLRPGLQLEWRVGAEVGDAQSTVAVKHGQQLGQDVPRPPAVGERRMLRQGFVLEAAADQLADLVTAGDQIWGQAAARGEVTDHRLEDAGDERDLRRILDAIEGLGQVLGRQLAGTLENRHDGREIAAR